MIALLMIAALDAGEPPIVVTGRALQSAYEQCAAGHCPPLRDAQASIAWAEQYFRRGDYLGAKRVLAAAVARNRGSAASDPKPVAALYEAYATVAFHDGDKQVYQRAVGDQVRTLRDHLPASDPAVTDAALAIGDMWAKLGNARSAEDAYRAAQQQAMARGQTTTAASAALRRVVLAKAQHDDAAARRVLAEIEQGPAAQDPAIRAILPAIRLRLAIGHADDAEIDRLVADTARDGQARPPTLLWAPPYQPTASAAAEDATKKYGDPDRTAPHASDLDGVAWADIGYWIRPDGRPDEIEVLRGSKARDWTKPIVDEIGGRRYSARADGSLQQGVYRVERFTLRPYYTTPVGSLIRRRAGATRLEELDLTAASATPYPPTPR